MNVRISRDMASRLVRKFGRDDRKSLPDGENITEVALFPYGSKVFKAYNNKYYLGGYAWDGSDVKKPLLEVWM